MILLVDLPDIGYMNDDNYGDISVLQIVISGIHAGSTLELYDYIEAIINDDEDFKDQTLYDAELQRLISLGEALHMDLCPVLDPIFKHIPDTFCFQEVYNRNKTHILYFEEYHD